MTKDMLVHDESGPRSVSLQIWDTAGFYFYLGQERFQSIGVSFYRGADCLVLVYDVSDPDSLTSMSNWLKQFLNYSYIENADEFPILIVGNKVDLPAKVQSNQVLAMADLLKMQCIEHKRKLTSLPREPPLAHHRYRRQFGREEANPRESIISFHTAHSEIDDFDIKSRSRRQSQVSIQSDKTEIQELPMAILNGFNHDDIPIFYTSAKQGKGIQDVFQFIATHVKPRVDDLNFAFSHQGVINVTTAKQSSSGCCNY